MLDFNLIKVRLISFGWSFLSLVVTTFAAVLISPDFATIVHTNFGTGASATLILLSVTELAKHLRNVHLVSGVRTRFGAHTSANVTLI